MATNGADKSLGDVVTEVTEKASLLVREEIELAKAEVTEKVTKLGKGAGALAAAGVLAVFALIFFLHALSWFFVDLFDWSTVWPGYLLTFFLVILVGAVVGFLGYRWLQGGAPPTPDLAIEEAKRTRDMLEQQNVQHDQLGRAASDAGAHARGDPHLDRDDAPGARVLGQRPAREGEHAHRLASARSPRTARRRSSARPWPAS